LSFFRHAHAEGFFRQAQVEGRLGILRKIMEIPYARFTRWG
jgi:hypothetical protein